MHIETFVIVTGLADDQDLVRETLTASAKRLLGPAAAVMQPIQPPAIGFALVVATPEPVTAADLEKLRHALELELQRREVMHSELAVELLAE
ncbi:MAG: hypothetical protein HS104_11735 [Polyangiaceae bacterium]|nr:hypothetical protein [Polyangiaceae bacterium]MCL4748550.1 hypothetical protein [Myxococcales bacterium]